MSTIFRTNICHFLQKGRWATPSVQWCERFVHRLIGKRGLDKPYFFPPGVSVLNKKKEGRCTHIWCSCHLNLFQHLCIIFLLSGTRAFQMSLRRPIWDAFSFYRHSEGRCGMRRRGGPLSDGLHQSVTPLPPIYDILFPILNRNGSFPLPGGSRFCISPLSFSQIFHG